MIPYLIFRKWRKKAYRCSCYIIHFTISDERLEALFLGFTSLLGGDEKRFRVFFLTNIEILRKKCKDRELLRHRGWKLDSRRRRAVVSEALLVLLLIPTPLLFRFPFLFSFSFVFFLFLPYSTSYSCLCFLFLSSSFFPFLFFAVPTFFSSWFPIPSRFHFDFFFIFVVQTENWLRDIKEKKRWTLYQNVQMHL